MPELKDDDLAGMGDVVDDEYRHLPKKITPGTPLALPDAYLKWYQLYPEDVTIEPAEDAEARALLAEEVAAGRLAISGDLGFVIHHRCGGQVHLLLVFTWRANNEMWETIYARENGPFVRIPETPHRAVMCVWEFGAVAHEHEAWTAYLRSGRDAPAKQAYADSQFTGTI